MGLNILYPRTDKITYRFELDANEMDSVVFALGVRKTVAKMAKDYVDLVSSCFMLATKVVCCLILGLICNRAPQFHAARLAAKFRCVCRNLRSRGVAYRSNNAAIY